MDLVSALAAGVNGAESGHAELYKRGTSTRADWYRDFEGKSMVSTGANIALNQYGAAPVYVNEYVDAVVYSEQGDLISTFTQGHSSPVVEYIGPSFTGAAYSNGAAGTGKPITLQDLLDLWESTNGAPDWKVELVPGSPVTIKAALGPVTNMWFNVKDPAYGATGDNVADDSTAIQAAIDACTAAGGGWVYFPPGTYRVTVEIEQKAGVSLLGSGPNAVTITMDDASEVLLSTVAETYQSSTIDGIRFACTQANTGSHLINVAGANILVRNCYIGNSLCDQLILVDINGTSTFEDCIFEQGTAAGVLVDASGVSSGRARLVRCNFVPLAAPNPANGLVYGTRIDLVGCAWEIGVCTSSTFSCFKASSTTVLASITGCEFETSGGATVTAMELGTYVAASKFVESANTMPGQEDANFTPYEYVVGAQGADVLMNSRANRMYRLDSDDASALIDFRQYGRFYWRKTGTTAITGFGPPTLSTQNGFEGCITTLMIEADGGGGVNVGGSSTINNITGANLTSAGDRSAYTCQTIYDDSNTIFVMQRWHEDEDF